MVLRATAKVVPQASLSWIREKPFGAHAKPVEAGCTDKASNCDGGQRVHNYQTDRLSIQIVASRRIFEHQRKCMQVQSVSRKAKGRPGEHSRHRSERVGHNAEGTCIGALQRTMAHVIETSTGGTEHSHGSFELPDVVYVAIL